jgi:hypothetical protein
MEAEVDVYVLRAIASDRLAEARAFARYQAWRAAAADGRPPFRARLGASLIALGQWIGRGASGAASPISGRPLDASPRP